MFWEETLREKRRPLDNRALPNNLQLENLTPKPKAESVTESLSPAPRTGQVDFKSNLVGVKLAKTEADITMAKFACQPD